jgi:AAA domain, putative AbiEii toxin, Type IV TA system/AAA ATPase domain
MLTRVRIKNFKRFDQVEIELGNPVVFIGPNNSGKTTALQALALWDLGLRRWVEKRGEHPPEKRPGVTINRQDLFGVPVPNAILLWRDLHVRDTQTVGGKPETRNIRIDIVVEAATSEGQWTCGLEFDFANEESFYCRPIRLSSKGHPGRMPVPPEAIKTRIAFLPPMSGLAANETRLDPGAIDVRLGEGRTAEVLRNLCYQVFTANNGSWDKLRAQMRELFKVEIEEPLYVRERGEITMTYRDASRSQLDISASGRGLQQTLLLLGHLSLHVGSVLLIDEPDAHLEILRQRQIYQVLADAARDQRSQVVIASHSEVLLNEAAERDVVVAFLGTPHRIDDRGSQVLKSLKEIGFEQYYQAEQTGWVLYLEGATDLAILLSLSNILEHPVRKVLEKPFVHYVMNQPSKAMEHFFGLREAYPHLRGFALFDRIGRGELEPNQYLDQWRWSRREIENYFCYTETLVGWARAEGEATVGSLFGPTWVATMESSISEVEAAMATLGKGSPWSPNTRVSEDFLEPLFEMFFKKLRLPNLMHKTNYHVLARHTPRSLIAEEVSEVLSLIEEVSSKARPQAEEV